MALGDVLHARCLLVILDLIRLNILILLVVELIVLIRIVFSIARRSGLIGRRRALIDAARALIVWIAHHLLLRGLAMRIRLQHSNQEQCRYDLDQNLLRIL